MIKRSRCQLFMYGGFRKPQNLFATNTVKTDCHLFTVKPITRFNSNLKRKLYFKEEKRHIPPPPNKGKCNAHTNVRVQRCNKP